MRLHGNLFGKRTERPSNANLNTFPRMAGYSAKLMKGKMKTEGNTKITWFLRGHEHGCYCAISSYPAPRNCTKQKPCPKGSAISARRPHFWVAIGPSKSAPPAIAL